MSRQETKRWLLKEITFPEGIATFDERVKHLEKNGYTIEEYFEGDYVDITKVMIPCKERGETVDDLRFFDILEERDFDEYGFIEGKKNLDGTIEVFASWYNGGAGDSEVVRGAIDKAEQK